MSDDRAMPVSPSLAHARTSAIDSAAAAAAKKHTADVKRAHKHLGIKDTSRISVLPFPSSINHPDAAEQLARSAKASASDIQYNDDSHDGHSSNNWIPGWEYPLQKSLVRVITPDKPTTVPLTKLMDIV